MSRENHTASNSDARKRFEEAQRAGAAVTVLPDPPVQCSHEACCASQIVASEEAEAAFKAAWHAADGRKGGPGTRVKAGLAAVAALLPKAGA